MPSRPIHDIIMDDLRQNHPDLLLAAEEAQRYAEAQILAQPLRYMDSAKGEGVTWHVYGSGASGARVNPVAAEAQRGLVIDGTARRV